MTWTIITSLATIVTRCPVSAPLILTNSVAAMNATKNASTAPQNVVRFRPLNVHVTPRFTPFEGAVRGRLDAVTCRAADLSTARRFFRDSQRTCVWELS